jgi:hypothetical protein
MSEIIDRSRKLEPEQVRPDLIITSSTFYKDWYQGPLASPSDVAKTRGDLTLTSLATIIQRGFQVIDIDGGSSPDFLNALTQLGVNVYPQMEKGISAGKREGILRAQVFNPKAIFLSEPEKPSIMAATEALAAPILDGSADIVFASRDSSSFDSYPPVQAKFEQKSNGVANALLKARGLLKPNDPDLDWWMGMRMIKNTPEVTDLFLTKYELKPFGHGLDNVTDLEAWSNALYLPVVMGLAQGLRVVGVPVHYEHPQAMTNSEIGNASFDRKRAVQYRGIITGMIEMIKKIEVDKGIRDASRPSKLTNAVIRS